MAKYIFDQQAFNVKWRWWFLASFINSFKVISGERYD